MRERSSVDRGEMGWEKRRGETIKKVENRERRVEKRRDRNRGDMVREMMGEMRKRKKNVRNI